jgi:hypothetical protein
MHRLFGSLTLVAPGSPEGPAEAQKVTAALDVFQLDLNDSFVALVQAEVQFASDARNLFQLGGASDAVTSALEAVFADLGKLEDVLG